MLASVLTENNRQNAPGNIKMNSIKRVNTLIINRKVFAVARFYRPFFARYTFFENLIFIFDCQFSYLIQILQNNG